MNAKEDTRVNVTQLIPPQPSVLIVGSGAREHAIAWKLAQSEYRPRLYAAPGNPGMAKTCTLIPIAAAAVDKLAAFAVDEQIDLVVIGPEQPLALGLADVLASHGIRAFGPSRAAAELETSKAYAKQVMQRAGVPTAQAETFTDAAAAQAYIRGHGAPVVVKADGLAAGKGVTVAQTLDEALAAVNEALVGAKFGAAGERVLIEDFLVGREVSLMCFVDGSTVVPMLPARDHKPVGDGDTGPNTGGMGAFAPVYDFLESGGVEAVVERIVQPTLHVLRADGVTYKGVLYVGLMLTEQGPSVIEFNARFGDPETEVVLPLLKSDLLEVLWAVADGYLADVDVAWSDAAAVCVVLAANGYPERPRIGDVITLPSETAAAVAFHAGTAVQDDRLVTAGGRVLALTALGDTLDDARQAVYQLASGAQFTGQHMRSDIAATAVERSR